MKGELKSLIDDIFGQLKSLIKSPNGPASEKFYALFVSSKDDKRLVF